MALIGPYYHRIDPIIGSVAGVHLWWYGLCFVSGFLIIHVWLRSSRRQLGLPMRRIYDLTLLVTVGVLLGGRFVEVFFYEWPFFRAHPWYIPAYWLGGMATHGLLLGAVAGMAVYCLLFRYPFVMVADTLVVPAALILGLGRIGNFIDGQIVGSLTEVWWAVKFPDADGFRHPVVLYDGAKNFLLVPILLCIYRRRPPLGTVTGVFLFLYAFLRIFIDVFREYPTTLLGLATGQSLNLFFCLAGLFTLIWSWRKGIRRAPSSQSDDQAPDDKGNLLWRKVLFGCLLLFALAIPSDSTQDIPARYSKRHPGLQYSAMYPRIEAAHRETSQESHTPGRPDNDMNQ
jgi:phosphatidylglycerol:prolipoprotein diacylglycerol transferase